MTIITKHFVKPKDIVALRIDCTNCDTSLSMPMSSEIRVDNMFTCPNCNEPWIRLAQNTAEEAVAQTIHQIRELNKTLYSGFFKGFSLSLEVTNLPEGE